MLCVEICHSGGRYPQLIQEYLESQGGEVTVHRLPERLPLMVDNPRDFLPDDVGQAAVIIAINLHQSLLLELPHIASSPTQQALIAPIEDAGWIKPGLRRQVAEACRQRGIECAFPRPFCNITPNTDIIKQFCQQYQIGKPQFALKLQGNQISAAEYIQGAPCGLTCWLTERLVGERADEQLIQKAMQLHHARPCLASMADAPQLGDTIKHVAVELTRYATREALREAVE